MTGMNKLKEQSNNDATGNTLTCAVCGCVLSCFVLGYAALIHLQFVTIYCMLSNFKFTTNYFNLSSQYSLPGCDGVKEGKTVCITSELPEKQLRNLFLL